MDSLQQYPADAASDYAQAMSCNVNNKAGAPETEWTFSSLPWPFPPSPFNESPLSTMSSPSIYQDSSWNPFDQSFSGPQNENRLLLSPNQDAAFLPPGSVQWNDRSQIQPRYPPGDPRGGGKSYVTLSAVNEPVQGRFKTEEEDDENDETPRPGEYFMDTHGTTLQTRQPAWGNSRRNSTASSSSRSTTKSKRDHKRRKSSASNAPPTPSQTSHRLRSTQTSSSSDPSMTSGSSSRKSDSKHPARTNHNQVEKQYRNRLNGQFETLLDTLPHDPEMGGDKRVSKAEVLVLAKKHIAKLEMEKRELEFINAQLEEKVEGLRRTWIGLGGVVLP